MTHSALLRTLAARHPVRDQGDNVLAEQAQPTHPTLGDDAGVSRRDAAERLHVWSSVPFALVHLVPLAMIWTGVTWREVALCAVLYQARMFFVTAGYHRYFAHHSFKANRFWQFVLALGGTTAAQKGPLWWAAVHRDHHRFADTPDDPHSPLKGFWWSHVGWILCDKYQDTRFDRIPDFARFPELRWLNRHNWVGPWALAVATFVLFGVRGLVVGFFLSTVLLWHGTFLVNSLAHVFGRRRYVTHDSSRNSLLVALVTGGEGWHNNHHYVPSSTRQGFFWWELDVTYYGLVVLSWLRVVRDLRRPPARLLHTNLIRNGFDVGMFEIHVARAGDVLTSSGAHASDAYERARATVATTIASTVAAAEDLARQAKIPAS
jgi:stearoyl-CoA desaturase (delta-9 desaturase)